jgi:UDP-N-acetylmuramate: L-alanyl-gamma-D-glutamyl-meso-diaminopimelate ligase
LNDLVLSNQRKDISFLPYGVLTHRIENGETIVKIDGQEARLKVFGNHNLLNMHAAWLACDRLGVSSSQFIKAIASFTGASKRLELLAKNDNSIVYRDFAHAPSKVRATMEAVRTQFHGKKLVAVLELHTYSSLNEKFMEEYKGVLDSADEAAVFYSRHALELKRMPELPREAVEKGFAKNNLQVFNEKNDLEKWLNERDLHDAVLLLMSSGNYDGINLEPFIQKIKDPAYN